MSGPTKELLAPGKKQIEFMAVPRTKFPIAEGLGIFFGFSAWDLLTEGHLEIIRAAFIAGVCSLAWFGLRCWKNKTRNKRPLR